MGAPIRVAMRYCRAPSDRSLKSGIDSSFEPERYIDSGDTVVATGLYSGTYTATGESFEAPFAHVWDIEDGEIVRCQLFIDTVLHNEPLVRYA